GQQPSPPSYDQSVPHEAGELPAEYNGLLPSREDPTVATDAPHSIESSTGAPVIGNEAQRDTSAKPSGTDFESAFAGMNLAPAKVAEDDEDEEDDSPSQKQPASDFDFSFDSPAHKQQQQFSSPNPNSSEFLGFDNNANDSSPSVTFPQPPTSSPPDGSAPSVPNSNSHDWESLFAPLDNISPEASAGNTQGTSPFPSPPKQPQGSAASKEPGWALQTDTGEDDLILQRLTGMGFSRNDSLGALEKFDYNLDKAVDYLTSKS
ncbi:hypothetical protein LTS12_028329, partial [Elasticomyces elasticus]